MTVQVYSAMTTVQKYSSGMKLVMYVDILLYVLLLRKVIHDNICFWIIWWLCFYLYYISENIA